MTVRKAAAAGMWSSLDVVLRQGVGFGVSIILARLLTPADFGIVALLTFFSNLSIVFVQGGLTTALVQQQDSTRDEESAVFWFNLTASVVFAAVLLAVAPWVARFYGYPILARLMPCAAAQVVFSALGAIQTALLTRNLQFGQLTIAGAVSAGLSGAIGIGAALVGFGVWAIALQMVSMAVINSAVLWAICDWRPVAHFRLGTIERLFRFGFYLSLSSILDVVNGQGFALIIGKLYGAADLGLFNRANGTQQFATGTLTTIISRVALPSFASRLGDKDALRRGLRMAVRLSMLLNVPAMVGVAVLSNEIISVLFGAKWAPAGPILALLAIGNILVPLHVINLQLILAQGRSDLFLKLEIIKKGIAVVGVVIGSLFGISGLAYAVIAMSLFSFLVNAYYSGIHFRYGAVGQARDAFGPTMISIIMASGLIALRPLVNFGPLLNLLLLVAAGGAFYCLAGFVLVRYRWPDLYEPLSAIVRRRTVEGAT